MGKIPYDKLTYQDMQRIGRLLWENRVEVQSVIPLAWVPETALYDSESPFYDYVDNIVWECDNSPVKSVLTKNVNKKFAEYFCDYFDIGEDGPDELEYYGLVQYGGWLVTGEYASIRDIEITDTGIMSYCSDSHIGFQCYGHTLKQAIAKALMLSIKHKRSMVEAAKKKSEKNDNQQSTTDTEHTTHVCK